MSLFAIADLHLPGGQEKPMSVFGSQWDRHFLRISESWLAQVGPEDVVLIPGDISWAMRLEEAKQDLAQIGALPGRKVLIRGNHDYWWNGIGRVREALPPGMYALQQDALAFEDFVVCGTRGWMLPSEENPLDPADLKIYDRELGRLQAALADAGRRAEGRPIVAMLHFPPLLRGQPASGFADLLEQAGVSLCVYGHLHGAGIPSGFVGERGGVRYCLTSCDSLDFQVQKINFL